MMHEQRIHTYICIIVDLFLITFVSVDAFLPVLSNESNLSVH